MELEIQPNQQVRSVVIAGVAAAAVIVGSLAVELLITDILCLKFRVEPRQVIHLENVAGRVGTIARTAGDRRRGVEERIATSGCAEVSDRAADPSLVVIFTRQLERLEILVGIGSESV